MKDSSKGSRLPGLETPGFYPKYASYVLQIQSQYLFPSNYRHFHVIQGGTIALACTLPSPPVPNVPLITHQPCVAIITNHRCEKVFGMAISTILQCFIADEEMFKGDERYGEGDLAAMLDKASRANSKGEAKVVAVESKENAGGALP